MPNQFEEFLESTSQNQQGTPGSNGETAKQYTIKQKIKENMLLIISVLTGLLKIRNLNVQ